MTQLVRGCTRDDFYTDWIPKRTSDLVRVKDELFRLSRCLGIIAWPVLHRNQLVAASYRREPPSLWESRIVLSLDLVGSRCCKTLFASSLHVKRESGMLFNGIVQLANQIQKLLKEFPYNTEVTDQDLDLIVGKWERIDAVIRKIALSGLTTAAAVDELVKLMPILNALFESLQHIARSKPDTQLSEKACELRLACTPFGNWKDGGFTLTSEQKQNILHKIDTLLTKIKRLLDRKTPPAQSISPLNTEIEMLESMQKLVAKANDSLPPEQLHMMIVDPEEGKNI